MKLSFRAVKGVPRRQQGLIYYAMLNKDHSTPEIISICEDALANVCKNEYDIKMMREFVSTDHSTVKIADKYFCSVEKVQRLFRKYITKAVKSITDV